MQLRLAGYKRPWLLAGLILKTRDLLPARAGAYELDASCVKAPRGDQASGSYASGTIFLTLTRKGKKTLKNDRCSGRCAQISRWVT